MSSQTSREAPPLAAARQTRSVREAAAILGISERNAFRLIESGELPAIRLGKRVLVPVAQLERILGATIAEPKDAA